MNSGALNANHELHLLLSVHFAQQSLFTVHQKKKKTTPKPLQEQLGMRKKIELVPNKE